MRRSSIVDCSTSMVTGSRRRGAATARDDAQAESFFARFKAELIENGIFESVEQARSEVFSYMRAIIIESDCIRA